MNESSAHPFVPGRSSRAYAAGLDAGQHTKCERPDRSEVVKAWYGSHVYADAYFAGFRDGREVRGPLPSSNTGANK